MSLYFNNILLIILNVCFRAALTSARPTANGIYCPPKLQATLDMQSGLLFITLNNIQCNRKYF